MIIIQETNEAILDILQTALTMEGFEMVAVLGIEHDFLALIEKNRPHAVILDYVLDGKESIKICNLIHEKHPHLPVIAISCNSNIHEVYSQNSFDDYIPKPFDLDLLFSVIRKYVQKPKE